MAGIVSFRVIPLLFDLKELKHFPKVITRARKSVTLLTFPYFPADGALCVEVAVDLELEVGVVLPDVPHGALAQLLAPVRLQLALVPVGGHVVGQAGARVEAAAANPEKGEKRA